MDGRRPGRCPTAWAAGVAAGAPAVTSLIIGARTTEQLADNLAAADLVLTAEERQRLDQVSAAPLLYPYWHQAKTARDRLSPADLTLLGPPPVDAAPVRHRCQRRPPPVIGGRRQSRWRTASRWLLVWSPPESAGGRP